MPDYRYFTTDIMTGAVLRELPQYGVYMSKQLSGAGQYTGFFRLDSGVWVDSELLDATVPGECSIMVQRDGINIWGGPIWSRTYSTDGKTIQLSASTFESIFDHIIMGYDCIYQGANQNTIIFNWMNLFLTQTVGGVSNDFHLVTTVQTPVAAIPTRTILIPAYEYHMATDFLQQIIGIDGGLDFSIDFAPLGDVPTRTIRFMYVNEAPMSDLSLEFPGSIDKYWMNEAGARSARRVVALGAGSGNQLMAGFAAGAVAGKPLWGRVESYPNVGVQADLNMKALSLYQKSVPPVYEPTVELRGDDHGFASWNDLGKQMTMFIQDARFPNGQQFTFNLTGWALTPEGKDGVETVQMTLEALT